MPNLNTAIKIADHYGYTLEEMFQKKSQFLWNTVRKKPPKPPIRFNRKNIAKADIKDAKR